MKGSIPKSHYLKRDKVWKRKRGISSFVNPTIHYGWERKGGMKLRSIPE